MHIYVILSRSNTIMAKAVRVWTRKKYSHAALALTPELENIYSFGRKNPRLILPGGFIDETPQKGYFALHPNTKICVLELELSKEQYEDVKNRLKQFTSSPALYKYNIAGIPFLMVKKPQRRLYNYTCSTFVAYVLYNCLDFKEDYSVVYPEDFFNLGLKKVYEGPVGTCAF